MTEVPVPAGSVNPVLTEVPAGVLTTVLQGGREVMIWTYGEYVSAPKWQNPEAQGELADAVYRNWEITANASGYAAVNGTAQETVVPKWQLEDGSLTDVAQGTDPAAAISFVVSGEVT